MTELTEGTVCPAAGICGGCSLQGVSYEEQLTGKTAELRGLFSAALADIFNAEDGGAVFDSLFQGIVKSPAAEGYRNKMEFTFGDTEKDGPLVLGMHKRRSFYDIVDAADCRIVDQDFRTAVRITEEYFRAAGVPYYHRKRHTGYLRHLLVRKAHATGEILIDLVTTSAFPGVERTAAEEQRETEAALLAGWLDALRSAEWEGTPAGVLHTRNDSVADAVKDEGTETLFGKPYITEELLGLQFRITPFSFFQTNSLGAEKLYTVARDFIQDGKQEIGNVVYDLYSGTGTIAQILAPAAKQVIGVEIVPEAVEAAKVNAAANGITNVSFLCGDVLKVLDNIPEKPDLIVLDPPRDGVHPKALGRILSYGVDRILYIACKPKSLARDLPSFALAGYRPVRMAAVDMFPFTKNIEFIALLSL